jgi:hypothetical protein
MVGNRAALRREQLADDFGQLLREVKAGERPEWSDISDRSYKSYWAQWKSLAVRSATGSLLMGRIRRLT